MPEKFRPVVELDEIRSALHLKDEALPWTGVSAVAIDTVLEWLEEVAETGGVLGIRARFLKARLILRLPTDSRRRADD